MEQRLFWLFAKWIKVDLENLITISRKKPENTSGSKLHTDHKIMSPSQTLLDQNFVPHHEPSLGGFLL